MLSLLGWEIGLLSFRWAGRNQVELQASVVVNLAFALFALLVADCDDDDFPTEMNSFESRAWTIECSPDDEQDDTSSKEAKDFRESDDDVA
jgi:hypothetical protein